MASRTISVLKRYIADELKQLFPKEEITALQKIILTETIGLPYASILAYPDLNVEDEQWLKINKICNDLKKHIPIQYIVGETEFFGLRFLVDKHTLIPRQETEELVALIIENNLKSGLRVLDIGTGSGAIAVSLAKNLNKAVIYGTDISEKALIIASKNAELNRCSVEFRQDNILDTKLAFDQPLDIVVSNPPYVMEKEKEHISPVVLENEPHDALFVPDSDPLRYYKAIAERAKEFLLAEGHIYFEINESLGEETVSLIRNLGYRKIELIQDLNGKDRIIKAII